MSTKTTGSKASHIRPSTEYKQESIKLAAQVGVARAAKQLGLHESQLYAWRKQSEHALDVSEREVNLGNRKCPFKTTTGPAGRGVVNLTCALWVKNAAYFAQQLKRGTNS